MNGGESNLGPEIVLESVGKTFKSGKDTIEVIRNLSLSVDDGKFLCVVGPSGCGKTTLLKLMCGLLQPSSGRVLVKGNPPDPKRNRFGVIFQEDSLLPWRNVLANVKFGLEITRNKTDIDDLAREFLSLVGLKGFEEYYPHQISGGMKKRVAIARAMAVDPEIILMDEPFADLDAQTRQILQKELLAVWSKFNKTVIFITHNVDEAVFLAQEIVVLTKRPATVKAVVKVNLEYPRARLSPPFISYREKILGYLHEEITAL
ncbi:MAG: ABC transporter ATP-binding protein [Candidatus Verstraetearchaeota archaeon]|nr:ABC transporter ATP-binding protein [Candidatus Verstraetearchaeota archaeon]